MVQQVDHRRGTGLESPPGRDYTIVLSVRSRFVDEHVTPVARRCSYAQIDRAVDHARDLYDPEEAEAKRAEQAEHRNVNVRLGDVTIDGQVYIEATTDLADALAFEAALAAKAHDLLEDFPHLSLDVRRSMALGRLGSDSGARSW